MVDVFISYAKGDRALVQVLAREIAREGYVVWWDDDIPPHLSYGEVITETIGGARAAIVVWSRAATASEWVRAEADMAREQKKLIQTSIDGGTPPLPFNQIQWAQLDGWAGEADHPGWRKVKTSLLALCGPAGGGASKPGTVPFPPLAEPTQPTAPVTPFQPPAATTTKPRTLGTGAILAAAIGVLLLIGLGAYFWLGREDAPVAVAADANNVQPAAPVSADAPPPSAPAPLAARFTQAAVLVRREGAQPVYIGPSESPVVVASVRAGEALTTYAQNGDWWQVRTADGIVGYLRRADLRLLDSAASGMIDMPAAGTESAEPSADRPFQLDGVWRMSVAPTDGNRDRIVRGRITINGSSASFALARGGETRARGRCAVARQGASRVRFDCTNSDNGSREAFDMVVEDARTMRGRSRDDGNPVRIRMSRR